MKQQMSITFRPDKGKKPATMTLIGHIDDDEATPERLSLLLKGTANLFQWVGVMVGGEVLHTTGPTEIPEEVPNL